MVRFLLFDVEGALWHATACRNERKDIVRDDADRETFVRIPATKLSASSPNGA